MPQPITRPVRRQPSIVPLYLGLAAIFITALWVIYVEHSVNQATPTDATANAAASPVFVVSSPVDLSHVHARIDVLSVNAAEDRATMQALIPSPTPTALPFCHDLAKTNAPYETPCRVAQPWTPVATPPPYPLYVTPSPGVYTYRPIPTSAPLWNSLDPHNPFPTPAPSYCYPSGSCR